MKTSLTFLLLFIIAISSNVQTKLSQPGIISISAESVTKSGMIKIKAENFNAADKILKIKIGNIDAIISSVHNDTITAYIPETAAEGKNRLHIISGGAVSNDVDVTITNRVAANRILWKFQADDYYIQGRPGLGADGNIYAFGVNGHLYALTPQGALKWIYTVSNGSGVQSVSVGSNGTIYFSGDNVIYALNPDGTLKWKIADPSGALFQAGPSVGPDGNIYAVSADAVQPNSLGAISITPQGNIRWSTRGFVKPEGQGFQTREIVFSAGQLYFCLNHAKGNGMQALKMSNEQIAWTVAGDKQPGIGPDGRIIVKSGGLNGVYAEISAYNINGGLIKKYFGGNTKDLTSPDVGIDGVFYVGRDYQYLTAENPDGTQKFSLTGKPFLMQPAVDSLNTLVVIGGSTQNMGFVAASSTNGQLKWNVTLPLPGNNFSFPVSKPMFSKDESVVYMGTAEHLGGNQSYFYAIATGATAGLIQKEQTAYADNIVENTLLKETTTKFYPNPAKNNLSITFKSNAQSASKITIVDMQGKTRLHQSLTTIVGNNNVNIDISSLSPGSYFLKFNNGNEIRTERFVKQ